MPLQLTTEQQEKINQATAMLPEGFLIYNEEQVNKLIELKEGYKADADNFELAKKIFRKVQPVFGLFAGKENMGFQQILMAAMSDPKILGTVSGLMNDPELKADFETISKIL